eukprot:snap_masked-scaffold_77-processed-gene-0.30-mRNA-1 protein AED:1.00 eAED:1.00 QI:0/0/0/0/1/1/2/0/360
MKRCVKRQRAKNLSQESTNSGNSPFNKKVYRRGYKDSIPVVFKLLFLRGRLMNLKVLGKLCLLFNIDFVFQEDLNDFGISVSEISKKVNFLSKYAKGKPKFNIIDNKFRYVAIVFFETREGKPDSRRQINENLKDLLSLLSKNYIIYFSVSTLDMALENFFFFLPYLGFIGDKANLLFKAERKTLEKIHSKIQYNLEEVPHRDQNNLIGKSLDSLCVISRNQILMDWICFSRATGEVLSLNLGKKFEYSLLNIIQLVLPESRLYDERAFLKLLSHLSGCTALRELCCTDLELSRPSNYLWAIFLWQTSRVKLDLKYENNSSFDKYVFESILYLSQNALTKDGSAALPNRLLEKPMRAKCL